MREGLTVSLDAYVIVTEVASGGELYERLVNEGTYGEAGASRIIKEAAAALAFLHSKDIVHADVKPENFVVRLILPLIRLILRCNSSHPPKIQLSSV